MTTPTDPSEIPEGPGTTEPTTPTTPEPPNPGTPSPGDQAPAEVLPGASEDDLRGEVRRLRDEAAEGRVRARRADTLGARLVEAYAAATGLLADPSDLRADLADVVDDDGLPDPAKVREAVETLVAAKPHLASRTPRGSIDQGARDDTGGVSLAGMLRAGA